MVAHCLINKTHRFYFFLQNINVTLISPATCTHKISNLCGEWGGAESRGNGARPVE